MNQSETRSRNGFGTFGGVFTPCTLTILGVIMFLRFGHVVGQAGVWHGLLIVALAKIITTLTALSLAAIATNTRVQGGGAYYLISRSLGVEFGGAIGIVFYLAQAISVALYIVGFTEAFTGTFPGLAADPLVVATLVNLAIFVCVLIGAGWAIRVQYWILGVLVAAILSFAVGALVDFRPATLVSNLSPHYEHGASFATMFALFFPAVTGIMTGANMSGDLAAPSRSIPRGTLAAIAATAVVYFGQTVLLGASRPYEALVSDHLIVQRIAWWPALIPAGIFAATLSSALGSMMGAPRILQAFARDEIFRWTRIFYRPGRLGREPRRATVATFIIAQLSILLGDLDAIAPIITMFFMITYGLLNLATFYEAVTKNPSYRPTFRYCHWSVSLAGAAGCLAVMFFIHWMWALVAIGVMLALHQYIGFREIESRWGDLRSGIAFERARRSLLRLEEQAYHPKNWRPVILALSGTAWHRPHLAIFGHWLTAGHGILSLGQVVSGDVEAHAERRASYEKTLRSFIEKLELQAFPAVVVSQHLTDGIEAMVQCHGIGAMRPNTVLFGWPNDAGRAEIFGAAVRVVSRLQRSIIAARFLERRSEGKSDPRNDVWYVPRGTIDIWWYGKQNGGLMVLLAHLLHQNPQWRTNRIRLLRVVQSEEAKLGVIQHARQLCAEARIAAEVLAIVHEEPAVAIQETSQHASVVILGFVPPAEGDELEFFHRMEAFAGELPRILFVCSAGGMELES